MMIKARTSLDVRRARKSDADDIARVFSTSWHDAYCGIIPGANLTRMIQCRDTEWWQDSARTDPGLLVLSASGDVCGYARIGGASDGDSSVGEIHELYLAPIFQGIGLGEHLFEACRAKLDDAGFDTLVVRALTANSRACDFYHNRGGIGRRDTPQRYGRVRLPRLAFTWC